MVDLGTLPGGTDSYAYGVNADGTVVVGVTYFGGDADTMATRWVLGQPPQGLGRISTGTASFAVGVSSDGLVVSGRSSDGAGHSHAIRWTAFGGMQDLGTLPGGAWAEAYEMSSDGSVITGGADSSQGVRPFVWTAAGGMVDFGSFLATRGVSAAGWQLSAGIVGPDGRTFGGHGVFNGLTQAFVTTITCRADFNNSGDVAVQDIFDYLSAWFAGDTRADVNGVVGLSVADIFTFLDIWFAGC